MAKERKIIVDLCGGTGSWSAPYQEDGGYDVRIIDPQEWLDGDTGTGDVRLYEIYDPKKRKFRDDIYGILAAPPCTDFSVSGARWFKRKGEARLLNALSIADACLRICVLAKPRAFWAAENPIGRLVRYWGPPRLYFQPCDYGDPYTKKTGLWGEFNEPVKTPVEPTEGSKMHRMGPSPERALLRSTTPPGFARQFFLANR